MKSINITEINMNILTLSCLKSSMTYSLPGRIHQIYQIAFGFY